MHVVITPRSIVTKQACLLKNKKRKKIHRFSVKYTLQGHVCWQFVPLTAVAAAHNHWMTLRHSDGGNSHPQKCNLDKAHRNLVQENNCQTIA